MNNNANPALRGYLELEQKLLDWREVHPEDTPEEDAILDEMDKAWSRLTHDEAIWLPHRSATRGGAMSAASGRGALDRQARG